MGVDRPDHAIRAVEDWGGHRVQAVEELLERPCIPFGDDLGEPRTNCCGVGERVAGEPLKRLGEVLLGIDRVEGQQHLTG